MLDKILSLILVAALLGATGILEYAFTIPKDKGKLADFYIMGPEGKAENYPKEVVKGQK